MINRTAFRFTRRAFSTDPFKANLTPDQLREKVSKQAKELDMNQEPQFFSESPKKAQKKLQKTFGKEFTMDEVREIVDPKGFVKKKSDYEYKELPKEGEQVDESHPMHELKPFPNKANDIGKEYGFKIKGLEPTRYGDWERKGRCTDF